jgi:hypothetical protein
VFVQLLAETERRVLDKGLGEVRGRVTALEGLPDRLTGLEVELDRTRKAQVYPCVIYIEVYLSAVSATAVTCRALFKDSQLRISFGIR